MFMIFLFFFLKIAHAESAAYGTEPLFPLFTVSALLGSNNKVVLGCELFVDKRLLKDGTISGESCHFLEAYDLCTEKFNNNDVVILKEQKNELDEIFGKKMS